MFSSLGSLLNSFRIPFRRRVVQSVFSRRGRRRSFVPSLGSPSALGVSLHDTLSHETLEQRRLLAADVSLDGTVLTVNFDDAGNDSISLSMNATGYQASDGANVFSGTGTITKLVVTDAGTAFTACVTINEASQQLTGGLSVDQNVHSLEIAAPIDTAGGDVAIDSSYLTLLEDINSGSGSQTYGPDTNISLLNDLNLTTSTGVAGDIGIHIQGTVDSFFSADPSALYLHSESVKVDDAIGSTTPLKTLTVVTENDAAQRGQFLRSVATVGKQTYRAQYTSGDVEFNGTYTTSDSDIELVGIGAYGVYLSLLGNTVIDVGAGSFSVQKVGASSGGQLFSNGGPYDLSITAANISVPAGMGIDDAATLPNPELGVFTIGGTAATNFDVSQVVATGGIVAAGEVRLQQAATLNSTGGAINLSGGLTLAGDTTLTAPSVEFSDGLTGNSHNLTLSPTSSSIKLAGMQLSGVNELTIGGDLDLAGNLDAQNIDIQGNTTLLGNANLTATGSVTQGINFGGTVDGGHALSTDGTTSFAGVVGGTDSLSSLTTVGGTVSVGGDVITTGNQTFGNDVVLLGDTTLTAGAGVISLGASGEVVGTNGNETLTLGDVNQTGDVTLGGGSEVTLGGLNVGAGNFNLSIDAPENYAVTVSSPVDILSTGDLTITSTNKSSASFVEFSGGLNATAPSAVKLAAVVMTDSTPIQLSHVMHFGDETQAIDLWTGNIGQGDNFAGADITLASLDTGNGALVYHGGLTGSLTVQGDASIGQSGVSTLGEGLHGTGIKGWGDLHVKGNATVSGNVSDLDNATVAIDGNVSIEGEANVSGNIAVDDNLSFNGDATLVGIIDAVGFHNYGNNVTLAGNTDFAGYSATFTNGVLGGGNDLTINFTQTELNGFSNVANFTSLGAADLNGTFTTTGDQNYADNVTLTGDTGFAGNRAIFTNGVLGGNNSLTINFTQPSKLDGLANVNNFTSIGQIELNGSFQTAGSQNFDGGVSLGGDATLHAARGFIKLNGIAGETYDLTIGNTTLPTPTANLIITSDVTLKSLTATTGFYDASLTGASMKLQQATFDNSGDITLGDDATDSLVIGNGLVVQDDAAVTTVAGTIASNGSEIAIRNINLTANTHIDTTNSGMAVGGAQILLDGNMQLGGFALDTKSGANATTLEGDITIANGSFEVLEGNLDLGESGNPSNAANIAVTETATIKVPESGVLNVFDGSQLDAGDNPITIVANNITFQTNAGNFTSTKEITITPATITNNISVGDATGDGLNINQTTFSKMQSPNITLGGSGYEGTITVENLTGTPGRLNLVADGAGGAISISGDLDLDGKDANNISLYIQGSGATTDLSGVTSVEGDLIIDDAVRVVGDSKLASTDGNITVTGGTDGIYSASGSNNDLELYAYNGTIIAGNQTGFGDNSGADSLIDLLLMWGGNTTIGDGNHAISGAFDASHKPLTILGTGSTDLSASDFYMPAIQGNSNNLTFTGPTAYFGSISDVHDLTYNDNGSDGYVSLTNNVTTTGDQNWNVPVLQLRDNEGTPSDDLILTAGGDVTISELSRNQGFKKFGSILSNLNLTIDAPSGNVAVDGVSFSGSRDVALGNVTISNAANVSLGGGFSENGTGNGIDGNLIMTGISDTVTLNATSGSSYLIGGELSIDSAHVVVDANVALETVGNLSMNATGTVGGTAPGVLIHAVADGTTSLKALGSSNITLTGTSGDQYAANGSTDGIRIGSTIGGNVSIETDSGNIELNGTAAGEGDEGITLHATTVETTGGGSITLIGKAGSGNTTIDPDSGEDNDGISFEAGTNNGAVYNTVIRTAGVGAGSISITGEATNRGEGIDLDDSTGATIIATDYGNVFLNGINTGRDEGVQVGKNTSFTVGGNLTIDGTGGSNGTFDGSGTGIKFKDSTANVTGTISFTGNSVDGYGTRLVSSQLRSITGGMTFTGSLTGNAVDGNESRAAFLSEGSSLTASTDINISYDLNHPSATAIEFKTEDGTASTVNSSIGDITLNGTAKGMEHAVYIGENTSLEAYENLTITGVYNGDPGQGAGYYYGVAVWDDVTLTAQNQALAISGSTTQESGYGYGVGFDDNNTLTGNTSVTIKANSQDWSYGDNLSVQGNGSLEIIPETADFSQDINLRNVTFGTSFTSAKIGVSTATGQSVQIGTQGLSVNGPIEIYGGTPIIDGEIASTAEGHSVLISGASGIEVGKNISTTNGALTLQGTTTVTDSIVLSSGSGVLDLTGKLVGEPAGQNKVTINTTGTATIVGAESLSEFVFNGGTIGLQGNVTTADSQTYDGTVQLEGNTTLQGFGLDIDGVVGNGNNFGLDFQQVEVLDGNFSGINNFTSGGDVQINGNFDTLGSQTYNANVSLGNDTVLSGTTLSLSSGIAGGGYDLDLDFSQTTTLNDGFAGIKNLKSGGDVSFNGMVATSGYQEYNANTSLAGNTTLQGTALTLAYGLDGQNKSLDLNFSNTTFLNDNFANIADLTSVGDVSLSGTIATSGSQDYKATTILSDNTTLAGNSLTLASGIDGNSKSLNLNFSQTTSLDGSFANISNLTSDGDVSLNGNFTTLGDQNYKANARLAGNVILQGESLLFSSGVNGTNHNLGLNFSQATALNGTFENIDYLTSGGDVSLNGTIRTIQSQTYNANVSLSGDTTLEGSVLSVASGVDGGGKNLDLNFSSTTSLGGVFSNISNLASEGNVAVDGTIQTLGSQTYNASVNLSGNTNLQGTRGTFAGAVNGNKHDLTLNFSAPTTIDEGSVFSGLANLTVTGPSDLGASIETSGVQTYEGPVTLIEAVALEGQAGVFKAGVQGGGQDLVLDFNETVVIDGNGVFDNLGNLSVGGNASLNGSIQTNGFQYYNGTTTLLGNTSIRTGLLSGDVVFGAIDGSHDLSIEAGSGRIDFFGALGSSTPLRSLHFVSASAVEANASLTIDGTGGTGPGLRLGPAVGNVNISQPGSTISNAAQEGILLDGGSNGTTLSGFTISNSGASGVVALAGNYSGTTFSNSTVTGSAGSGFASHNADGFTVSNSEFGTNADHGIRFDANKNSVARNNTIGNNGLYGVLVVTSDTGQITSNISVNSNFIGTDTNENALPNGRSGIWVLGSAEGHGSVDNVTIRGNRIANNAVHGIEVWSATNLTLGGTRGDGSTENIITDNAQYGIAFTDYVMGSLVHGNSLSGNRQAGLFLNGAKGVSVGGLDSAQSLDIQKSDFGVVAGGDLSGTTLTGNTIHENSRAGFQLLESQNLNIFRNTIQKNGAYGVLAMGDSRGSRLYGNAISDHEAGVWLAGARGMVIGSLEGISNEQAVGNKIQDNSFVGIIIQGEDSFDNVILSNQIDANIYYGIQFVQGARTVSVPRLVSVTTEQITGRIAGDDGDVYRIQFFYTPASQVADGRTAQGEYVIGYEDVTIVDGVGSVELDTTSSGIAAGDIVTATATLMHNGTPSQSSSFSQGRRVQEPAT